MGKKKPKAVDAPVFRITRITPIKGDGSDGMFVTHVADSLEDLQRAADFLRKEIAASESLEWVRELRDEWARYFGPDSKPSNDPLDAHGRELYQLAEAILEDGFLNRPLPEVARWFYNLGRAQQRLELEILFNGMVRSGKTASRVAKVKADGRQTLDESQWHKVFAFIGKRPKGVSVAERCKQASDSLTTGTFKGISRVEIGCSAIRKKFDKRQA